MVDKVMQEEEAGTAGARSQETGGRWQEAGVGGRRRWQETGGGHEKGGEC